MMRVLPETDLIKIQDFTMKLFQHYEDGVADEAVCKFLKPMSREDFMKDIEIAEQEIADGKCRNAKEGFNGQERLCSRV